MNHLAHFHLARQHPDLLAGAILGDFIKGPLKNDYPPGVVQGIKLHRKIDAVTDDFIRIKQVHTQFDPTLRRCLGIALDVYFDHILCRQWSQYCEQSIHDFQSGVFATVKTYTHNFPPAANHLFSRMVKYQFLTLHQDQSNLNNVYSNIADRLSKIAQLSNGQALKNAAPALIRADSFIEQLFTQLYPQLQKVADQHAL